MIRNPFKGKHGPLLIAEIGGNHEGNFEYALELTRLAIGANVDYIKFQLYTGDTLVSKIESPHRNEHFKKFELSKEQHIRLAQTVAEAGLGYMASVWDTHMMQWIDPYIPVYKIGSGDLTAYPLIREIVSKQKPVILSTGLSTQQEVIETVRFIQDLNPAYHSPDYLALLQCTSMYPIAPGDANLAVIPRLKELTGLTVGYSDHTEGIEALVYAYLLGAEIFEFHFTDSRQGKQFRDHFVSLTPQEVILLQNKIKEIDRFKGNPLKQPLPVEIENGHHLSFRRAVYPNTDIRAGEILTLENLTCLRPNHGIDAREFDNVLGKKTKINLHAHQQLSWDILTD